MYEHAFSPPETLLTFLGEELRFSDYPVRAGNHIENRGSMINFSIVGRDCSLKERKKYFEWDEKNGERKIIAAANIKQIKVFWKYNSKCKHKCKWNNIC